MIKKGFIIQEYEDSGEYHLYKAKYDEETEKIFLNGEKPLCNGGNIIFDRASGIHNCGFKTESAMAKYCGEQNPVFRHQICGNCIGHFYKTR